MPATVDDIARETLHAIGSNAGLLLAVKWVSERYRQISNRTKFRHLRRIGELTVPAVVDTGLITVTRGSDVVTGDATAVTAWTPDLVGRFFRGRRNWHRITGVDLGASTLKLDAPFAEDDLALAAYDIAAQHVRVADDARFLGRFVHMRLQRPLATVGLNTLNLEHPARIVTAGSGPESVTEIGDDVDGVKLVEFYPYPTQAEMIRYTYWPATPELRVGSIVPDDIDPAILRDGALIDAYRFEMANALRGNQVETAAVWRNEARAQETAWNARVEEAIKADRALEDVTLILHTRGMPISLARNDAFIRTARQDAWDRLSDFP